ncbi:MAG: hypothetical protein HYX76_08470, partial [Acidobacteria bacterium]|nr:hypothetical protein [Acidobacteriota bacterium]
MRALSRGIPCDGCGAALTGGRRHRRHCSSACRARACRRRRIGRFVARLQAIDAALALGDLDAARYLVRQW